jgi:hypothetical protein
MVCVSSQQPDDTRLWSYLDGEADFDVQAHIEQCPHCRQRALELAALQRRLLAGLYRAVCPTSDELGEYQLGLLPADQASAMTQHLAECPHCTREVAQLQTYLADLSPAQEPKSVPGPLEQVQDRVRTLIAQLASATSTLGGMGQPGLAPALAGIRGQEQTACRYEADGIEVVIDHQPDYEQPGCRAILGLIIGLESTGVVAALWQRDQRIATSDVDDLDTFTLAGVPPGTYELLFTGPEIEILVKDLKIEVRSD